MGYPSCCSVDSGFKEPDSTLGLYNPNYACHPVFSVGVISYRPRSGQYSLVSTHWSGQYSLVRSVLPVQFFQVVSLVRSVLAGQFSQVRSVLACHDSCFSS